MRHARTLAAAFAAACLLGPGLRAADAEMKARAKETMEKCKDAIVTVKLVISTRYVVAGREENKQEQTNEIPGTVMDPSGLTVMSNHAVNPSESMADFAFAMGGEKTEFKVESDITDVKIVLTDGTEVPAVLVLKDKDLDLAFIKPKEKPERPFACVTFAKASAEPELLDDVFAIGRQSRAVNRVPSLHVGRISALVKKPRMFYICETGGHGVPVFNAKGETLGLSVMRIMAMKESRGGFGFTNSMMTPVVLPSDDLLEVAKQAAAAKVEPKKGEKKEEKK